MAVVGAIYVMSALTYGRTLRSTAVPLGFHAQIADALLDGRLDVLPVPDGLLDLADPYDPGANAVYRAQGYHDFALYEGRIFTATGPTTAVLLHLPPRLLGLGNLNPNLATLLCCLAGFLISVAIFVECRRRFFPATRLWFEVSMVFAVGLGSPALWLVSIGRAYESAIACGYLLMTVGLYCLLRALRQPAAPRRGYLFGAGVSFAAAVGARASLAPGVLFLAVAAIVILRSRRPRAALPPLAWLLIPYLAIGAMLTAYNYARFEAPTDFGMTFQLAGVNMQEYPFYRVDYILPNVVDYLLLPPRTAFEWPFVFLQKNTFFDNPWQHAHEPIAGVFWLYPLLAVGLVVAVGNWRCLRRARPGFVLLPASVALFAALVVFSVAFVLNSSTMRYTVDFAPVLGLAACAVVGAVLTVGPSSPKIRRAIAATWVGATVLSCAIGIALVITPCPGTGSC